MLCRFGETVVAIGAQSVTLVGPVPAAARPWRRFLRAFCRRVGWVEAEGPRLPPPLREGDLLAGPPALRDRLWRLRPAGARLHGLDPGSMHLQLARHRLVARPGEAAETAGGSDLLVLTPQCREDPAADPARLRAHLPPA